MLAAVLSLAGCGSDAPLPQLAQQTLAPQGRAVYLRGEMNDYAVLYSYLLVQQPDGAYCTLAPLRADWSPYRFKFADKDWTAGSNFGFAEPPGVLREGSAPVRLNAFSRFEELRFYPKQDGIYRFCMTADEAGKYYASVRLARDEELSLMDEIFKRSEQSSAMPTAAEAEDADFAADAADD